MKYFDEPFNIRRDPVRATGLFDSWADLMPESCDKQKIIQYVNDLSSGYYRFMNPTPFRKNYSPLTSRIVFKIHELQHMMQELAKECELLTLYLIRHPVATSLSREEFPRLEFFLNSEHYMEEILSVEQSRQIRRLSESKSHIERGAISWAFENIDILSGRQGVPDVIACYEELVLSPDSLVRHMSERLELHDCDRMLRKIEAPASNIYKSNQSTKKIMAEYSGTSRSRRLITKWRDRVSDDTEKRCFDILTVFGIDAYSYGRYMPTSQYLLRTELSEWNG